MSTSTTETRTSRIDGPDAVSWRDVLVKAINRRIAQVGAEHRVRRDVDELMALDDRMLADVGLHRSEIEYVVRHGRWSDQEDRQAR